MATDEHNSTQPSAAQARVTPEELAQAVARIEARQAEQQAQAAREAETIPIGQAVEELGLGMAPEEILAEIEAQRTQDTRRMAEGLAGVPLPRTPLAASTAASAPLPAPLGVVPQPPTAVPAPQLVAEVASCPACGRKLLTRTSALCNWCGARIDNPNYQAQAEAQRQALDQAERTQVDTIAQEEAKFGVFGRLKRRAKLGQGPKPGLG